MPIQLTAPQSIDDLVDQVRREYAALPGLRLTESQVRKLWGIDSTASTRVLRQLVDGRFLTVTHSGQYVRADGRREVVATESASN